MIYRSNPLAAIRDFEQLKEKKALRKINKMKKEEAIINDNEYIYVKVLAKDYPELLEKNKAPVLVKPPSDRQLATRMKFGMANQFLSQVRHFITMAHINPKKSPMAPMVSHLIKNCFVGEYPNLEIDYSKVLIGRKDGRIRFSIGGFEVLPKTTLYVYWSGNKDQSILFYLLIYNIDQKKFEWTGPMKPDDDDYIIARIEGFNRGERIVLYSIVTDSTKTTFRNSYLGEATLR